MSGPFVPVRVMARVEHEDRGVELKLEFVGPYGRVVLSGFNPAGRYADLKAGEILELDLSSLGSGSLRLTRKGERHG